MIDEIKIVIKSTEIQHTYLMKSNEFYKIGFSTNVSQRLQTIEAVNPHIKLIGSCKFNCENFLHKKYSNKKHKYEWFNLSNNDVEDILQLFKQVDIEFDIKMNIYAKEITIEKQKTPFEKKWLDKTYQKCIDYGYQKMWVYHQYLKKRSFNIEELKLIAEKLEYSEKWATTRYNELFLRKIEAKR